ncbi:MAG: hypothetical protein HQL33_01235 [Alphaproteobacteria bacterium]|nr:hypothetical protein [Alphaproteobacteria bacterium]
MLEEMVMAKVDATQASMLSGMAGNSYTVGQVTTTGNGLGTWLFLSPDGGASAGPGVVAVKLEGTRQMAQMSGLVGKSVTVGKAPLIVGGTGKWLVLTPKAAVAAKAAAGAAGAGVAAAGVAAAADSQLIMLKLEGAKFAAQTPFLAGKTVTVVKTTTATAGTGKWLFLQQVGAGAPKDLIALKVQGGATHVPWLVGKTFTVGKAPIIAGANASKYLVLQPVAGAAGKGVVAVAAAAKGACPTMKTIALTTGNGATTAAATAGKAAATMGKTAVATGAAATTVAKTAAAGTIWTGTGMSLGLGLGLGAAGPAILGAVIALTGYGIYRYRKSVAVSPDADEALLEAIS